MVSLDSRRTHSRHDPQATTRSVRIYGEDGPQGPHRRRFDTPEWAELKVHPDHHVRFGQALYSVPYQHRKRPTKGQKLTVRGDRHLVRIYLQGELVQTHPKIVRGDRSTDFNDYPPEKTPYAMRDSNYLIRGAKRHGASIGEFTEHLLGGDFPWAKLRQAQALMRCVEEYDAERVDVACRRALSFDLINVKRVERIVLHALHPAPVDPSAKAPTSSSFRSNS